MQIKGKIEITLKGFGFLICEDKKQKDIFISKQNLKGAMDGDIVFVKIIDKSAKVEGKVVEIIERRTGNIVGTFHQNPKFSFGFVIPDDKKMRQDVFIPKFKDKDAKDGDKVVTEITKWPKDNKKNPEGKVIEVLGHKDAKGVDILSVIKKFGICEKFDHNVLNEVNQILGFVSETDIKNRLDLRKEKIVTIDGKDSKDLDDAISISKLDNGNFMLSVHIADVAHYVKEGSKLDTEAFERSNSTYLIDTVVPMLPKKLSNGICSLNPHEDRLTMSCIMQVNKKGDVVDYRVCESVINSSQRLIYSDVSDDLESKNPIKHFKIMKELALILKKKRQHRGTIDFDFSEPYIVLNKKGKAVDIKLRDRRIANKIIEEFMILANETVAEHVQRQKLPFVYRVHEVPSEEKIIEFNKFLFNLGYKVEGSEAEVHPKALQEIQDKIRGTTQEDIVSKMMLRSLKQAKYSPDNDGHFGLASEYYCHFTSPIRRYPDLIVHRVLKDILHKKCSDKRIKKMVKVVDAVSVNASERERISEKAERDVYDMKMAEYMEDKIGEVFEGAISSVVRFGMFVELANCVEGLVKIENLKDDYYIFDENRLILLGERTKKSFKVGDKVNVLLVGVSVERREVSFELV